MLAVAACGPTVVPAGQAGAASPQVAATAAPTIVYQMVQLRTRTPTPGPVTAVPTATFVPLVTPSAVARTPAANTGDSIPRITVQAAKASLDGGAAVLVDVRTAAAYQQGHAAGAISIPSTEVADRYTELPADKQLILYCA